jgi:hypothetical protein
VAEAAFSWEDGRPVKDFRGTWSTLCESASIRVLVHGFRRTAVRNLIRAGVSRDVARRLSGHGTESIFSRYNIRRKVTWRMRRGSWNLAAESAEGQK